MASAIDAVREAIATQRERLQSELDRLDAAEKELAGTPAPPPAPAPAPAAKPRRRARSQKGTKTNSPAAAIARREEAFSFIQARGEATAADLRAHFGWSPNSTRKATSRLEEEGRIRREGERNQTRYVLVGARPAGASLEGRVLDLCQGNGERTRRQLVAETGATDAEVLAACAKLVDEGELESAPKGNDTAYAPRVPE